MVQPYPGVTLVAGPDEESTVTKSFRLMKLQVMLTHTLILMRARGGGTCVPLACDVANVPEPSCWWSLGGLSGESRGEMGEGGKRAEWCRERRNKVTMSSGR